MAKQTYTIGQTLTAAQMTALQANDFNQTVSTKTANYVLVASDAGTKIVMNAAGSTTITVNTSLFTAGDTLTIANIGAGVCTVTAGTATVSSAGPLAIPQFGGGTLYFTSAGVSIFFPSAGPAASSGLTFISSGSVGTSTTFSLPTSSFTSTYQNYKLFLNSVRMNAGANLMARMRASGTDTTSGDYNFLVGSIDSSGNYAGISGGASATNWRIGSSNNTELGVTSGEMNILSPQTTAFTRFTTLMDTGGLAMVGSGSLVLNTQYDSMTLFSANGTAIFSAGTYTLYGLANS
jgi:hypothetical protein